MRHTCLHDWHISHGASMTDFNGWDMPLYYKGITEEHLHTRSSAGIFDLCHMGRVRISGQSHRDFINFLTPARVGEAQVGEVQYSFLLQPDGTTLDDITIYYEQDSVILVINAGGREGDLHHIRREAEAFPSVVVENLSEQWGMLAIQGCKAYEIVKALVGATDLPAYYRHKNMEFDGITGEVLVSCTGYTGENGYEFYLPVEQTPALWSALLSAGGEKLWPIGLGARDSLRLEAAMPLYGHELTSATTPYHAGLGKFVELDKSPFIGQEALRLLKENGGPKQKLAGFRMTQRGPVAREGFSVLNAEDQCIGQVTSGIFSPTLKAAIGMAYLEADQAKVGQSLQIEIRGKKYAAEVIKRPFYKRSI